MDTTQHTELAGDVAPQLRSLVAIVHADSAFAQVVAAQVLALHAAPVTTSARAAARDLETQRASALVLDWDAPAIDGAQLLQSLGGEAVRRVVVCSRYAQRARAEYARTGATGPVHWLQTPCTPDELLAVLSRLISA